MRTKHLSIFVSVVAMFANSRGYSASKLPDGINVPNQEYADESQTNKTLQGLYSNSIRLQVELTYQTLPREHIGGNKDDKRLYNLNEQSNESTNEHAPKVGLFEKLFRRGLRSLDNEDSANKNRSADSNPPRGWGVPSMSTVKSWTSWAYSSLPNMTTVSSYVVASYLPSKSTVQSYLPSAETIKYYLPLATEYLSHRYLGGFNPVQILTKNETDQLVNVMSDKILHDKDGNITDILNEVGHNLTQQVVTNSTAMLLRMVVHKVIYGIASNKIGPIATFLVQNRISEFADIVADNAVRQCQSNGFCKVDVFSYLKKVHWKDIAKGVVQMAQNTLNKTSVKEEPSTPTPTNPSAIKSSIGAH